jgi:hypothetical protein
MGERRNRPWRGNEKEGKWRSKNWIIKEKKSKFSPEDLVPKRSLGRKESTSGTMQDDAE